EYAGKSKWLCRCSCDNKTEKLLDPFTLRIGSSRSCGCLNRELLSARLIDLTGRVFGRWTVIRFSHSKKKRAYWLCRCSCDKKTEKMVQGANLCDGQSKSCGCWKIEKCSARLTTHGLSGTPEFMTYCEINRRCYNPVNGKMRRLYDGILVCR